MAIAGPVPHTYQQPITHRRNSYEEYQITRSAFLVGKKTLLTIKTVEASRKLGCILYVYRINLKHSGTSNLVFFIFLYCGMGTYEVQEQR